MQAASRSTDPGLPCQQVRNDIERIHILVYQAAKKVCVDCQVEKILEEFPVRSDGHTGGFRSWCRSCNSDRRRFNRYGMSAEQYKIQLQLQNGVCAICKQPETATHSSTKQITQLVVDHEHTSGKIRKLLCSACNVGLGNFKDNPELLRKAALYLEDH